MQISASSSAWITKRSSNKRPDRACRFSVVPAWQPKTVIDMGLFQPRLG